MEARPVDLRRLIEKVGAAHAGISKPFGHLCAGFPEGYVSWLASETLLRRQKTS